MDTSTCINVNIHISRKQERLRGRHHHSIPGSHSSRIKKRLKVSQWESSPGWGWRWRIICISIVSSPSRGAAEIFKVPPLFLLWSRWATSISATLSILFTLPSKTICELKHKDFPKTVPFLSPNPRGDSPCSRHHYTNLDWFDRSRSIYSFFECFFLKEAVLSSVHRQVFR